MTRLVFYQNPYLDKVGLSGMWLGGKRQSPSLISKPLEPVGTLLNVGQFIKTIQPDRATSLGAREITLLERLPVFLQGGNSSPNEFWKWMLRRPRVPVPLLSGLKVLSLAGVLRFSHRSPKLRVNPRS